MKTYVPLVAIASLMASTAAFAQDAAAPNAKEPAAPVEKMDAPATPSPATEAPAATESMTPATDAASPTVPAETAALTLTEDQAKKWVGKTVYSSDDKNLGEVAAFTRDSSGKVEDMHADIGGFLGLGETRVRVTPEQMRIDMDKDRVVLNITADQAETLPKIEDAK